MRILVASDSHRGRSFLKWCIDRLHPNAVVHLGDYYEDAQILSEEYPYIPFHMVAGNCDQGRAPFGARELLCYDVCGVRLFMTHGHNHHVKQTTYFLTSDAKAAGAAAALFGHTHRAVCYQEGDLWVVNPGSCVSYSGTVALLEVEDKKISACTILTQADVESKSQQQ